VVEGRVVHLDVDRIVAVIALLLGLFARDRAARYAGASRLHGPLQALQHLAAAGAKPDPPFDGGVAHRVAVERRAVVGDGNDHGAAHHRGVGRPRGRWVREGDQPRERGDHEPRELRMLHETLLEIYFQG